MSAIAVAESAPPEQCKRTLTRYSQKLAGRVAFWLRPPRSVWELGLHL